MTKIAQFLKTGSDELELPPCIDDSFVNEEARRLVDKFGPVGAVAVSLAERSPNVDAVCEAAAFAEFE